MFGEASLPSVTGYQEPMKTKKSLKLSTVVHRRPDLNIHMCFFTDYISVPTKTKKTNNKLSKLQLFGFCWPYNEYREEKKKPLFPCLIIHFSTPLQPQQRKLASSRN